VACDGVRSKLREVLGIVFDAATTRGDGRPWTRQSRAGRTARRRYRCSWTPAGSGRCRFPQGDCGSSSATTPPASAPPRRGPGDDRPARARRPGRSARSRTPAGGRSAPGGTCRPCDDPGQRPGHEHWRCTTASTSPGSCGSRSQEPRPRRSTATNQSAAWLAERLPAIGIRGSGGARRALGSRPGDRSAPGGRPGRLTSLRAAGSLQAATTLAGELASADFDAGAGGRRVNGRT
jgi:hypothetical protein